MNTFIVGPEKAGKTVLATMLKHYVSAHPDCGLLFRECDSKTQKHLNRELRILKDGEWPRSTIEGALPQLEWEWLHDGVWQPVSLVDPAGQDIRSELCSQSDALGIVQRIREADLLILVVDIYGHATATLKNRIGNAWIVEQVLKLVDERKSVIFAVSKADMLTGSLPEQDWSNQEAVLNIVETMMPEFELEGYRDVLTRPSSSVLAFSAVATLDPEPDATGEKFIRLPDPGLRSKGFEYFIERIVDGLGRKREQERAKRIGTIGKVLAFAGAGLTVIVVVMVVYFWIASGW